MAKEEKTDNIIYDNKYYQAKIIVENDTCLTIINWLKNRFSSFNCPIPDDGFKSLGDFLAWQNKIRMIRQEMINDKDIVEKINNTGHNNDHDFIYPGDDIFPPVLFHNYFEMILDRCGITKNRNIYSKMLFDYLIFGHKDIIQPLFEMNYKKNEGTKELELWIKVNGNTRREHIIKHWPEIAQWQKSLPDYRGKNKEDLNFDIKKDVYKKYKDIKSTQRIFKKDENVYNNIRADKEVSSYVFEKYDKDASWENIRKIVHEYKKRYL